MNARVVFLMRVISTPAAAAPAPPANPRSNTSTEVLWFAITSTSFPTSAGELTVDAPIQASVRSSTTVQDPAMPMPTAPPAAMRPIVSRSSRAVATTAKPRKTSSASVPVVGSRRRTRSAPPFPRAVTTESTT